MQWSKAIRISAIHDLKHFVVLVEVLLCKREDFDHFSTVSLIDLGPVVHFDFFDVLLPIFLLLRLLALARVTFDRLAHLLVDLGILRTTTEI